LNLLPIRQTLFLVFGITSFIIFYIGLLNFLTTESYSSELEDTTFANTQLGNAYKTIWLNEVISHSVTSFVYTEDPFWEDRHFDHSQQLNLILENIKFNSESGTINDLIPAKTISNTNLQKLETKIIKLAKDGQIEEAIQLVNGEEYINARMLLASALNEYRNYYEIQIDTINKNNLVHIEQSQYGSSLILLFGGLVSVGVMIGTFYISNKITDPIKKLDNLMDYFSKNGKASTEKPIETGIKELDELSRHFEHMAKSVEKTIVVEKKLVKELQQVDQQKNQFASMVSHELKTPLVPIMGYSEMLKKPHLMGKLNSEQSDAVNTIHECSVRLQNLIGDILLSQKLDMDKLNFNTEEIDIENLISNIINDFEPAAAKDQIKLINSNKVNGKITDDLLIGKTIALTRRSMSLLLNMLSRLVITFLPRSKRLFISWL